jgi:hypothetical protein
MIFLKEGVFYTEENFWRIVAKKYFKSNSINILRFKVFGFTEVFMCLYCFLWILLLLIKCLIHRVRISIIVKLSSLVEWIASSLSK